MVSLDKIMSLEYGRDYDVPLPHLDVDLPTVDQVHDQHPWVGLQSKDNGGRVSQPNQSTLVFYQGCRLMLIAIRIMDTVYCQGRHQLGAIETDSPANIHELLDIWYNDLPTQLRVPPQSEVPSLPHVIVLNITYRWLLMLLHRPFSFRMQPQSGSSRAPTLFTGLSADICEESAKKIVQLVVMFDQSYGCRFFPLNMLQTVFISGATLLGKCTTSPGTTDQQRADVYTTIHECIRTLRAAAQTWEIARLYASQLEGLLREQIPRSSIENDNPGYGAYEPSAPEHDDTASRMFRDFIVHHDPDAEELGIPPVTMQYPFPLLQQLNQQSHLGVSLGSEFIMDPDAPSPPFGLPPDEGEFTGELDHDFPGTRS